MDNNLINIPEGEDPIKFKAKCKLAYEQACKVADDYVKKHDFCKIRRVDGKLTCAAEDDSKDLCCTGCNHIGPDGCTVQSIGCKVCFCHLGESPAEIVEDWSDSDEAEYLEMREKSRAFFKDVKPFHGQLARMSFEQHWKLHFVPITKQRTHDDFLYPSSKFIDE